MVRAWQFINRRWSLVMRGDSYSYSSGAHDEPLPPTITGQDEIITTVECLILNADLNMASEVKMDIPESSKILALKHKLEEMVDGYTYSKMQIVSNMKVADDSVRVSDLRTQSRGPIKVVVTLRKELKAVKRFAVHTDPSDTWYYRSHQSLRDENQETVRNRDGIAFTVDVPILLAGVGLFSCCDSDYCSDDEGSNTYSAFLFVNQGDLSEREEALSSPLLGQGTKTFTSTTEDEPITKVMLDSPVSILPGVTYTVSANIFGPPSIHGREGMVSVTEGEVTFTFISTGVSGNGTGVNSGTIPELLFY